MKDSNDVGMGENHAYLGAKLVVLDDTAAFGARRFGYLFRAGRLQALEDFCVYASLFLCLSFYISEGGHGRKICWK